MAVSALCCDNGLQMIPPLGTIASPLEIKARWAYSELRSPRAGSHYPDALIRDLRAQALSGAPFSQVAPSHWEKLAEAIATARGASYLLAVDRHKHFRLEPWSKGRLCQSFVVAQFNPPDRKLFLAYYDFLIAPPGLTDDGRPDELDPRAELRRLPPGGLGPLREAAVAVEDFPSLLIDGYLRSLVFMRDAPATAKLPVWVGKID